MHSEVKRNAPFESNAVCSMTALLCVVSNFSLFFTYVEKADVAIFHTIYFVVVRRGSEHIRHIRLEDYPINQNDFFNNGSVY